MSQGLHPLLCGTLYPLAEGPSLTPRASAICVCFQPRSFVAKARKRLPSRQLVASLEGVFSILRVVIPMSLDLYADICNSTPWTEIRLPMGVFRVPKGLTTEHHRLHQQASHFVRWGRRGGRRTLAL